MISMLDLSQIIFGKNEKIDLFIGICEKKIDMSP